MMISNNLQHIKNKIISICQCCNRDPNSVDLLAVSKTKSNSDIEKAIIAGQRKFGENYVQEGIEKIQYFKENHPNLSLEWHFIGPLQSNKSRLVAENFDWIQTVDRQKIATRLNEQRPINHPKLNVLIQINISDENSKSGIQPNEMLVLAQHIMAQPRLNLRGLMAIPKPELNIEKQKAIFNEMTQLYLQLKQLNPSVNTLSMGMSEDMESAIVAGSTMVRIGSAIFGKR